MPVAGGLMGGPRDNLPPDRQVLRQAAQWLARLHPAAQPPPDVFHACERWRAQSPDHEQAWQRAQQLKARFDALPPELSSPVLNRKLSRRKALITLGAMSTALPAAWLAWRVAPSAWMY